MHPAAKLLLAALLAFLAAAWGLGALLTRPANRPVAPPAPPGRVIRLTAADGNPIEGSYWPGAAEEAPAILLLHGINADREMFTPHARWLSGLGYAVLAIDFRGQGASASAARSFGWREAADAEAAFAWLCSRAPRRRIGIVGVSMGGAAALLGREGPLPADAMVLDAVYPDLRTAVANRLVRSGRLYLVEAAEPWLSYQSWPRFGVAPGRIAPIEGLRRYKGPVLILGGTADRDTKVADSRAMFAAAPGPKALWLVAGAGHVEMSKLWTPGYRSRIRSFFARSLGEPGAKTGRRAEALEPQCANSPSSSTPSSTPARATAS